MEENTQWGRGGIILWRAGVTETKFRVFRNEPQKSKVRTSVNVVARSIADSKQQTQNLQYELEVSNLDSWHQFIKTGTFASTLKTRNEHNWTYWPQFKLNNKELFKIVVHYGVFKRLSKFHYFDLPTHLATSKNVPLLSKGEYDE
jgi:hypothetical protein